MPQIKRTTAEGEALITEQRTSGQTQAAWCAAKGVNLHTLRDRSSRLNRMGREQESKPGKAAPVSAGWMEVMPGNSMETPFGIRIEHGGFTVTVTTGFDAELLTEVLRAVSRVCC